MPVMLLMTSSISLLFKLRLLIPVVRRRLKLLALYGCVLLLLDGFELAFKILQIRWGTYSF